MRKVICAGETILDILFKNNQPIAAVPGGSSFNCIISLGRAGVPAFFLGETGEDAVGDQIAAFLKENQVSTDYFTPRKDIRTAVSLAYLNEKNDAQYVFYKDKPKPNDKFCIPDFQKEDILVLGSYYAICPSLRAQVKQLLHANKEAGGMIYYDINFRKSHQQELEALTPAIQENFTLASIVRGSADDFEIMYGTREAEVIYKEKIAPYCPVFICTNANKELKVCLPDRVLAFPITPIKTVSTIGAGDNFNAGFVYGLMRYGVKKEDLLQMENHLWEKLVNCGLYFAANVCQSIHNSIDPKLDLSCL